MIKLTNHILDPDIYSAEDMADYRNNAPKLKLPVYKHPFINIKINDVYVQKLKIKEVIIPTQFEVYDYSGEDIMKWDKEHDLCPTRHSFKELQEISGLKSGDMVDELFFRYFIKQDFSSIVAVKKYRNSNKRRKVVKDRLDLERVFSDLIPIPSLSFRRF